jgi:hypothetical protein
MGRRDSARRAQSALSEVSMLELDLIMVISVPASLFQILTL